MELQEIEVFIDTNGEVRLHVCGVKGESCLDLTRELEAALGGQVASRQMTPEALETAGQDVPLRQTQKGG
jgi:hypothetical protein